VLKPRRLAAGSSRRLAFVGSADPGHPREKGRLRNPTTPRPAPRPRRDRLNMPHHVQHPELSSRAPRLLRPTLWYPCTLATH